MALTAGLKDKRRILGIDPGLITTGYGVIEISNGLPMLIEGGLIRISAKLPLEQRLSTVFLGVQEVLQEFAPDAMALEEVHTQYERPRVAVMMGHARGVICLAASLNGVPLFSYAPTHIKSALTGNGRASKEQVRRMIQSRLNLKVAPESLDVSDALAVALCHMMRGDSQLPRIVQDYSVRLRRRA